MVSVICLAIITRRPVIAANAFAFAWLIVIIVNPTDPFTIGCQLSFLSVFMLIWAAGRWFAPRPLTPSEELLRETRTALENGLRSVGRKLGVAFGISLLLVIANAPLLLSWQNIVSPIAIVIGPPMILLTSIALIAGFFLLLLSPFSTLLAWPFARITEWALLGSGFIVESADRIPGAYVYAPAPPMWWLIGFYILLGACVLASTAWTRRLHIGVAGWVFLGLVFTAIPRRSEECTFTFLAVGHGGCVVIQTPDNRVILYDAGTTAGPDIARRIIAPFLWHKGISRIDEIFLSHADLDHFNGVPELAKRFAVGQVTITPSFSDKSTLGVELALDELKSRNIPIRVAALGNKYSAGELIFEVLHPPLIGPEGNENTRSMVVLTRYREATVLLTGDIEGEGQEMLRSIAIERIDVMMAPHHGAKSANMVRKSNNGDKLPSTMANWARPKMVISSQKSGSIDHLKAAYAPVMATIWDTHTCGAIEVRWDRNHLVATAFRTGERSVVK